MANEAEQAIYSGLRAAPVYHPVDVTLLPEDWTLEAGDVVTVQNAGESYNVPVFALDYTWKGGLTAEAQSTGNQKREPLSALRKRYYGGVGGGGAWSAALTDKKFDLIASKVEFENLKNGGKTFFQDTSSKISTEETRAKAAEKTNSDNIGTLNYDFGQLTTGQLEAQSIVSKILAGTTLTAKNTFVYRTDTMYKRTLKLGTIQSADALAAGDATSVDFDHAHALSMDSSGHVTMGAAVSVGDSRATFNVAATTWFQQQMAAYREAGYNNGWGAAAAKVSFPTASTNSSTSIKYPPTTVDGNAVERALRIRASGNWSGGYQYIFVEPYRLDGTGWDSAIMRLRLDAPTSPDTFTVTVDGPSGAHGTYSARCVVCGKTYTTSGSWSS